MKKPFDYTVGFAYPHTCWDSDDWDGTLHPATCAACAAAEDHPCRICGYGHVFPTHTIERHTEAGDPYWTHRKATMATVMEWADRPHIYADPPHTTESQTLMLHDTCLYCGRPTDGDGIAATRQEGVGALLLVGDICDQCVAFADDLINNRKEGQ